MYCVGGQSGFNVGARLAIVVTAAMLLWCNCANAAETKVYLLRGWFGVFSTGLDSLAEELKAKGIKAETAGHLNWKAIVAKIAADRAAGDLGPVVLVGHSQGANNVIEMAQLLDAQKIPVALLITLAPIMQDPVPKNVARAINYYQSPGWGAQLTTDVGFRGKLSNVDLAADPTILHISIDKSARVQADIVNAILAASQEK